MAFETISFGLLSKIYDNLKNNLPEKVVISQHFGLRNFRVFSSWLKVLTEVRNVCAHHSRLWNRKRFTRATVPRDAELMHPWVSHSFGQDDKARTYIALCIIAYMLDSLSLHPEWKTQLIELIETQQRLDYTAMGWQRGWKSMPIWMVDDGNT